ncbi:short chain dehydrogenase domain-containing protein [Phthorimaea operculella]|nr:short chain dehydrogenase domain-containing protein [Phthorimaea operculella]
MAGKVAVVTGSNKGIGFAIVKELLRRGVDTVYLTSRDVMKGKEAVEKLKKLGHNPEYHQLEVTDVDSVKEFAGHLKQKHGGLDILINNAGVVESTTSFYYVSYEEAKRVLDTNYFSILTIQKYLFPMLRENARVINVSSDCGHISNLENKYWIQRLTKEDIKLEDINAFVQWFLDSVKNRTVKKEDWCGMHILSYRTAKVALCALTRVQQKEVGKNISVNSLHPGLVQTDMTWNIGMLTAEQAAETPVYLALDVDQSVKGKYFWFDKKERDWADHSAKLHFSRPEIQNFLKNLSLATKCRAGIEILKEILPKSSITVILVILGIVGAIISMVY